MCRLSRNSWSCRCFTPAALRACPCMYRYGLVLIFLSFLTNISRWRHPSLVLSSNCWCNWRTFWRKNAHRRKVTKRVLFLHYNAPAHRALANQKKLAYLGFKCLDHPPYSPDLALSDYHLFPGPKKKTIERSPFSVQRRGHCCRGDLVGRTIFCVVLCGLQKLEQLAKKCIELRGKCVE